MTWTPKPGGPYEVAEADYHADRAALTSTGARNLVNYCPEKFLYEREHGRPDKPHFDEGRAAHAELLGVGAPLYVPCDPAGEPYKEWRTDDAKAQVKAARARGETPVKPDVAAQVAAMAAKLREHPTAGPLLARPGKAEQTYVARDPDTNVLCKIRVDWEPDVPPGARRILVDYKGCICAEPKAFERRMAELGYDQQADFYRSVVTWRYQLAVPPVFVLIAQEKTPPYLVSVLEPDSVDVLDGAHELNREALRIYADCDRTGVWPGYNPNPHRAGVPGWRAAQYEAAYQRRRDAELIGASA